MIHAPIPIGIARWISDKSPNTIPGYINGRGRGVFFHFVASKELFDGYERLLDIIAQGFFIEG
jgi:hypothetical protein